MRKVLVHERTTDRVTRVSPNAEASDVAISRAGDVLAFESPSPLGTGDTNDAKDVFVTDPAGRSVERVSPLGHRNAFLSTLSLDGQAVAVMKTTGGGGCEFLIVDRRSRMTMPIVPSLEHFCGDGVRRRSDRGICGWACIARRQVFDSHPRPHDAADVVCCQWRRPIAFRRRAISGLCVLVNRRPSLTRRSAMDGLPLDHLRYSLVSYSARSCFLIHAALRPPCYSRG
jgi:hypothetical protein